MRTSGKILVIVALVVLAALMMRNMLIKGFAEKTIHNSTGFEMSLQKIDVGILGTSLEVDGLKLNNPQDFPDSEAFDIKRLYVNYDLLSLFTDNIHLQEVVLDIPHVVLVEKSDGETNLQRLQNAGKPKAPPKSISRTPKEKSPSGETTEQKRAAPKSQNTDKKFKIDRLTIKLGEAEWRTYPPENSTNEVQTSHFDLNVDKTVENVTSVEQISIIITTEVLRQRGAQIFQSIVDGAAKSGTLRDANDGANKGLNQLNKSLNELFQNRPARQ